MKKTQISVFVIDRLLKSEEYPPDLFKDMQEKGNCSIMLFPSNTPPIEILFSDPSYEGLFEKHFPGKVSTTLEGALYTMYIKASNEEVLNALGTEFKIKKQNLSMVV